MKSNPPEASEGKPATINCFNCDGDGFYIALHRFKTKCPHCNGTGKQPALQKPTPSALPTEDFDEVVSTAMDGQIKVRREYHLI